MYLRFEFEPDIGERYIITSDEDVDDVVRRQGGATLVTLTCGEAACDRSWHHH